MMRFPVPRNVVDRLDAVSRTGTWIALAAACLAFIVFDWMVPKVGTGPLYLPLIALAGWRLGPREAWAVAVAAAFLNILPLHGIDAGMSPLAATVRGLVRFGAYAFVAVTVSGLRRAFDRERHAARHDTLTGALNRASFEAHARTVLGSAILGAPVTVLALADIDGFKAVNDTAGHAAGDDVLRRFSASAATLLGKGDRFGRLGGDEFVLLLQASTTAAAASRVEAVHRRLRNGLRGSGHSIGVSMGALVVPPGATTDWTAALREADRLMYVAKRSGKGGFRIEISATTDPVPGERNAA